MHGFSLLIVTLFSTLCLYGLLKFLSFAYAGLTNPIKDFPGPRKASWIWGNFRTIRDEGNGFAQENWVKEYGRTYVYWEFQSRLLYTMDLKAIRHIITHTDIYEKPEPSRWLLSRLLGNGVLITEGDLHKQQRRVMNPAFGVAQIRELTEIFVQKSNQLRDILATECQKNGSPINIASYLSKATLDIIGLAGFNYEFNALNETGESNQLSEDFASLFKQSPIGSPLILLKAFFPFFRMFPSARDVKSEKAKAAMVHIGRSLIQEIKDSIDGEASMKEKGSWKKKDLLSLLVRANVADDLSDGMRMSEEDVLAQIPTFMVAGHETTSTATSWALFALSIHPEIQTRLRDELLGLKTDSPTMDELNSLSYLDHVLREVLRVYSPVPMSGRTATADDVIPLDRPIVDQKGNVHESIRIMKGQDVDIPIIAINRDENLWGSDAKEFKPERWESIPPGVEHVPGVWGNLLTFLGGNRTCIGYRFSLVETKALLFALVRSFEFALAVDKERISSKVGVVQRPRVLGDPDGMNKIPLIIRPYSDS